MKKFVFFFGVCLSLLSCNTPDIGEFNPDFIGEWQSETYNAPSVGGLAQDFLTVDGRNGGLGIACQVNCPFCNCLIFQSGRVRINTSTKQIAVSGSIQQIMTITKEPFVNDDGIWQMEVNELAYFKK
jgi:hypothetical protein